MSYLIRLITPPTGLVLDPFMGSGTTGVACKENGFEFLGIEREEEYFKIAQARIGEEDEDTITDEITGAKILELVKEIQEENKS